MYSGSQESEQDTEEMADLCFTMSRVNWEARTVRTRESASKRQVSWRGDWVQTRLLSEVVSRGFSNITASRWLDFLPSG